MLVEVVKPFSLRGQPLDVGVILDVPEGALDRLGDRVAPLRVEAAESEYLHLLAQWWDPATENLPIEEIHRLLARLDVLYQALHRQGRKVPIRLPVERHGEALSNDNVCGKQQL